MGLAKKILNLCGYKIWSPTHNDPRIKGPQPRIITKRQKEWIEKLQRENPSDGVDSVDNGDGDKQGAAGGRVRHGYHSKLPQ